MRLKVVELEVDESVAMAFAEACKRDPRNHWIRWNGKPYICKAYPTLGKNAERFP